jgi:murein DD-endopeptidase MepM/ murein hydrolase activator NlpD
MLESKYMKKTIIIFLLLLIYISPIFAQNETIRANDEASQGKVVRVTISSTEALQSAEGSFIGQNFLLFKQGDDSFRGIVGIPIEQKPGNYTLKLFITGADGEKRALIKTIKIKKNSFPFSKFWLPPARNKLRARTIVNNEWGEIEKVLLVEDLKQRWIGSFSWPAEAAISQGFGHREIINNRPAGSHRGVDVAVPGGTKIFSPNSGKIVFTKQLKAFGGTIVIDHGQGIHTLYFHLSRFLSKVGDEVHKGDLIALSGNSGISSGAHLHWGMSVHNLRVDPVQWTEEQI